MNEPYFEQVILDISNLCEDLKNKTEMRKNSTADLPTVDGYRQKAKDREELYAYLTNLTDETLNTICALMHFGRMHQFNVLPINLDKLFNKHYLSHFFEINKSEEKSETALYLISIYNKLPVYLNRAKDILFYSKDSNIPLVHKCGGYLCLDETDGIVQVDHDMYELHLTCLNCKSEIIKRVNEEYFKKEI